MQPFKSGPRGGKKGPGKGKPAAKKKTFFRRKKVCRFTVEHIEYIDYIECGESGRIGIGGVERIECVYRRDVGLRRHGRGRRWVASVDRGAGWGVGCIKGGSAGVRPHRGVRLRPVPDGVDCPPDGDCPPDLDCQPDVNVKPDSDGGSHVDCQPHLDGSPDVNRSSDVNSQT